MPKIVVVDSAPSTPIASRLRVVAGWAGAVVLLSLIFGVQEGMWHRLNGTPIPWLQDIVHDSADWIGWGIVAPVVIMLGRGIRLDSPERRAIHVLGWMGLAVVYWLCAALITGLLLRSFPTFFGMSSMSKLPVGDFLVRFISETSSFDMIVFAATAAGFHAMLYYRDLRERELRERALQARLARAELSALRTQLQPHFLFNALHTISALMVSDVDAAQRVVTAVGDLLRTSLDQTQHETTLRDELAFVQRYLDIQSARFRNRMVVDIEVPEETLDALVPSFVFQPLVENAVRHGIEPSLSGGRIWLRAGRRDGVLTLGVENEAAPPSETRNATPRRGGNGIGLANLDARVRQLYGSPHGLQIDSSRSGRFEVTVTVPYHTRPTSLPVDWATRV